MTTHLRPYPNLRQLELHLDTVMREASRDFKRLGFHKSYDMLDTTLQYNLISINARGFLVFRLKSFGGKKTRRLKAKLICLSHQHGIYFAPARQQFALLARDEIHFEAASEFDVVSGLASYLSGGELETLVDDMVATLRHLVQ